MAIQKRNEVFVWPSWICKLVAGEEQCEWKYWLKAHYTHDKKPSNFNLDEWTIKHNQLLRERREALERLGFKVFVEDQNAFKLEIKAGDYIRSEGSDELISTLKEKIIISGKADIVAIGQEEDKQITNKMHNITLVEDCKTGNCKTSDRVQVILYMLLLPKAIKKYKDTIFSGTIVYKLGVPNVDISPEAAQDEYLKKIIWDTIKLIAGDESKCRRVPSENECRRCDICKEDCDERIE